MNIEEHIRKVLKEDLQGQEFIDEHYKELKRFEKSRDKIIDYIKLQYENLYSVDFKTKKVLLGSIRLGMENPTVDVVVVTLKFRNLKDKEVSSSSPIKKDIINMSSMEKLRALSVIKDYKKTIIKLKKLKIWMDLNSI
jgi:hypothetical protein